MSLNRVEDFFIADVGPCVLLDAERQFLKHAFATDAEGRLQRFQTKTT
jgi:hypothetical protein